MKNNADPKPKTADWSAVEVSMVAGAKKTETRSVAVGTVLADIQSGKWREEVNAVAAGYAKAYEATRRGGKLTRWPRPRRPVRKDKEKLPGILFSGSFSRRASDALEMHSGILCVDMDNCSAPSELRAKLTNDPHVLAAFVSPTGSGVKALVRVKADASVHADNFAAARKHFGKTFGVSVDEACKDVSRLCFASYDPDAFIREEDAEILSRCRRRSSNSRRQSPSRKPKHTSRCHGRATGFTTTAGAKVISGCRRALGFTIAQSPAWTKKLARAKTVDEDYRICAPLVVLAKTSTRGLEHGRLVEFVTSDGSTKRHIVPMRLFAGRGEEALGELLSLGLETVRHHQSKVISYIQEATPADRYAAALCTGWQNDDVFVLPDEILVPAGHTEKTWYGGRDSESPYKRAGTLSGWQEKVAALAPGNQNLVFAICASFAGPLLHKFGINGALPHLVGQSSIGKTTVLSAAASAWGGGEADSRNRFIRSWQATAVGIEAIASLHSDTLVVLDELHLCDPKVLDPVIYAFANGIGKSRGNVHACLRSTKTWRVFGLSSGEVSSATWLHKGGFAVRSGQAVRMLDIPVQGKFGAFDDLHGAKSASDFAHALYRNTVTHYGHAGPALVRALIEENPDLDELLARAMANFQHGDPVQGRAARMFAVVAVAGALAQHFGIVPWPATEAINAAVTLYGRWREELIASGAETPAARICQMVATYISRFGDARFSNVEGGGDDEPRVYDRAGYWEKIDDKRIYLLRSDALLDAAKGHDLREIGNALKSAGALHKVGGDGRHLAVLTRTPYGTREWFYYVDIEKLDPEKRAE